MSLVLSKKGYNKPKKSSIIPIIFLVYFFLFAAVSGGFLIFLRAAFPVRFRKAVEKNAEETGVEISLIYAVIRTESSFRENAVSEKGAIGLMQILPSTADHILRYYGFQDQFNLFDGEDNIRCGVYYLQYLLNKFSDERTALAAYNAGEGRVAAWLCEREYSSDGKTLSDIPYPETKRYVDKIERVKTIYSVILKW